MSYCRIMVIICMILALSFAVYMLEDLNSNDISISTLDASENVGMYWSHGIFTMQDAFEMDMFGLITFNLIPLMMIIGVPILMLYMYFSDKYFDEEDR